MSRINKVPLPNFQYFLSAFAICQCSIVHSERSKDFHGQSAFMMQYAMHQIAWIKLRGATNIT
jgi:hypothetical protein